MCQNKTKIKNIYNGRYYYVECGKCESCRQQKADKRANRIRHNESSDRITLFCHLTYSDAYIPYFYKKDLELCKNEHKTVKIYRKRYAYWFYNRHIKESVPCSLLEVVEHEIGEFDYEDLFVDEFFRLYDIGDGRVGVLFYKDFQNFVKRLKQNLLRNDIYKEIINKDCRIKFFVCGEYGETNQRPHWHFLLSVPRQKGYSLQLWQDAICRSWLYAFDWLTRSNIQEAICASKYVSEYVNCSTNISNFLQRGKIRPQWHYSHHYGFGTDSFHLSNIVDSINNESICYNQEITVEKSVVLVSVPLPRYVRDYYFPRWKSFCILSYQEIFDIVCNPSKLYHKKYRKLGLSFDEIAAIVKKLDNCYNNRWFPFGFNRLDFGYYYLRHLQLFNSYVNSRFYKSQKDLESIMQSYDNIFDVVKTAFQVRNYKVLGHGLPNISVYYLKTMQLNCNNFVDNLISTNKYRDKFFKRVKQKKVNQLCPNY